MAENLDLAIVNEFVEELTKAGVRHICVSPGSRSTPLTLAMARHSSLQLWSLLDERSAAYFAYGLARRRKEPVVLLCTSGTATANYFPAVMEASQTRVPLLIITADRPPELQGVGSNQTVDQVKLFGSHVKMFLQMPVPEASAPLSRHARQAAWRAVLTATSSPAGPVHINWPFREPLIPPLAPLDSTQAAGAHPAPGALAQFGRAVTAPDWTILNSVLNLCREMERGVIVCGPQDDPELAKLLIEMALQLQIPLLADPLSQVRTVGHTTDVVIDGYDILLRDERWFDRLRPDVVLRFGRTPTSKALGKFLQAQAEAWQVVVDEDTAYSDPYFTATHVAVSDPREFCQAFLRESPGSFESSAARGEWLAAWIAANADVQAVVTSELGTEKFQNGLFEGQLPRELMACLPSDGTLMVGNSMPVRDFDSFLKSTESKTLVMANRGVSGIDGVVSTALGIAAAESGPVVLVIGDVSFYHDLNALLIAKRHALSLVIVLIHNDGGGIFSFLPQAAYPETFEHFQTSHGLDFRPAVEMYGGRFVSVRTWSEFRQAVGQGSQ
ncbi:MAG: 2-succinyl-5-enolpyruvyl-6-hydroxy-3-cyclohexene-1-carboxylic-acid synthase, partial [Alicyclobacillus sp. RIFOXYA1_FULL_53_8]